MLSNLGPHPLLSFSKQNWILVRNRSPSIQIRWLEWRIVEFGFEILHFDCSYHQLMEMGLQMQLIFPVPFQVGVVVLFVGDRIGTRDWKPDWNLCLWTIDRPNRPVWDWERHTTILDPKNKQEEFCSRSDSLSTNWQVLIVLCLYFSKKNWKNSVWIWWISRFLSVFLIKKTQKREIETNWKEEWGIKRKSIGLKNSFINSTMKQQQLSCVDVLIDIFSFLSLFVLFSDQKKTQFSSNF